MGNVKMRAEGTYRHGLLINAFVFTGVSLEATPDHEVNMMFVRNVIQHMARVNQIRGHVFLNEVLDALGLERMSNGATDGWFDREIEWDVHETSIGEPQLTIQLYVEPDIHKRLP